jgi:hypothetical protein
MKSSWISFLSAYHSQICHYISGEYELRKIRSRQYMMRENSVSQNLFLWGEIPVGSDRTDE